MSRPIGSAQRTAARPSGHGLASNEDLAGVECAGSTPRLRLLHVFPTFNIGGAQMRFAALAEAMGERFAHTVLSLNNGYEAASLVPPGAPVRYVGIGKAPSLAARLKLYRSYLDDTRPDLLLTYNWGGIEFALANAFGRTPHIHMEDGFGPEEARRQFARRVWTRRVALCRSQIVVPSLTLKEMTARTWRLDMRNVHHIPNAIAPKPGYTTPIASLGLNLDPGLVRIVWTGALRREKNLARLLRAFAPVKDRATLLLIGDGAEREAVVQEAERLSLGDRLHLLGRRADARDLIMQCHVLAISSDTEQMPLAVLEAMDAALPVASVDVGDVGRMVAPENRPFIVPVSSGALAGALETLVADPQLRAQVGAANRKRLRETYAVEQMVEAYRSLFERMTAAAARL